jgi:hypothetical protein
MTTMSKRSKHVKSLWRWSNVRRDLGRPAMSLKEWARSMARFSPVAAAWLKGKCEACHAATMAQP